VIGEGDHKDVVARLLSKISSLQQAAAQAEELRRKLHNQIIEMRGNVRAAPTTSSSLSSHVCSLGVVALSHVRRILC
jgi:hypothetical protein